MKLYRLAGTTACLFALIISLCTAFREHYVEKDEDEKPKQPSGLFSSLLSHDHPRVISIFSKPPDGPKRVGPGIVGHLGNVLHGGTIGIQVQPLTGIQGIVGHAKKIITGGRDRVGNPNHENPEPPKGDHWEDPSKGDHLERPPKDDHWGKPPRDDHWGKPPKEDHSGRPPHWGKPPKDDHSGRPPHWGNPPKDDHSGRPPHWGKPPKDDHLGRPPNWGEPPKDDHWGKPQTDDHYEEEPEWEMKDPEKVPQPDKGGYNWDDIGEDQDGHSTEVPIEDIIMPRTRPKRFIESKIYHVPLMFKSNGKTYKILERTQNSLDIKGKP